MIRRLLAAALFVLLVLLSPFIGVVIAGAMVAVVLVHGTVVRQVPRKGQSIILNARSALANYIVAVGTGFYDMGRQVIGPQARFRSGVA